VYDFNRCKLCGKTAAAPKYKLKQMTLYVCASCDFHYIDALDELPPVQPDKTLLTDKAEAYINSQLPQNSIQLKKNLQFVKAHVSLAGRHCLDIGSGAGVFPAFLQEAGAEAQGIEPQQIFREFALKKFQLRLRAEPIDEPCWQNEHAEYFDVVTLWDTLEHVNFPLETLKAACNVIKPGGHLFLDTPSRDSFFYRASEWSYRLSGGTKPLLLKTLYSPKPFRHKQIFTAAQLWELLECCGFNNIERSSLHRSKNKLVVACRKVAAKENPLA
jgi:2-polyprenyl-6-hydroxyphenyl methylase/3-demethylubiquinone-9 3-methyltransferase